MNKEQKLMWLFEVGNTIENFGDSYKIKANSSDTFYLIKKELIEEEVDDVIRKIYPGLLTPWVISPRVLKKAVKLKKEQNNCNDMCPYDDNTNWSCLFKCNHFKKTYIEEYRVEDQVPKPPQINYYFLFRGENKKGERIVGFLSNLNTINKLENVEDFNLKDGKVKWQQKLTMHTIKSDSVGSFTGYFDDNNAPIFFNDKVECVGGESCFGFKEYNIKNFVVKSPEELEYVLEFESCYVIGGCL